MSYRDEIDKYHGQPWRPKPQSLAQVTGRAVKGWEKRRTSVAQAFLPVRALNLGTSASGRGFIGEIAVTEQIGRMRPGLSSLKLLDRIRSK